MIPTAMNPMGINRAQSPYFELIVKPTADSLTYGFTPQFWVSTGYCEIVDWGDGTSTTVTTSGTMQTHTYATAGTYRIKIDAECYRVVFGNNATYAPLVYAINNNFSALGTLTNASNMFASCTNVILNNIELPDTVTHMGSCFFGATNAVIRMRKLPAGLENLYSCFRNCTSAIIDISELASNAPVGGYLITDLQYAFNGATKVTGSQSAFLEACPLATSTVNTFTGTNTTA